MIPILPVWSKKKVHSSFNLDKAIGFSKLQDTSDTGLTWGALAFTLRISRFFGTAPSSFERTRVCWRIGVSPAMCVYSYVFIIVLNILIFSGVVRDASVPASESLHMTSEVKKAVWIVDVVLVTIISVYGILSGPCQMKHLIVYLNHINMILSDLDYEHIIVNKPEKLKCFAIILYILGAAGLCTADIVGFTYDAMKSKELMTTLWLVTWYYVEALIVCLLPLQFYQGAMLSHTALQCLNEELTTLIDDIDLKSSTSQSCSEKIRHLSLAYSAICDAVRQIDKSNGLLVLLLLFSFLVHLVVTPYNLITYLFRRRWESLMQLFWGILHTSKLLMIVEPGHRMQLEITKTQMLLGHLMNRASSPRDAMMDELNLFQKQITLNPVVFSPLGVCTLSRPLIASIFGAITTYLVILVQFQDD